MGKLDTTITVSNAEYRPCFICVRGEPERKALFHRWEDKAEIVPHSPLVCGPDGGVVRGTVGIVEFEDGTVGEFFPSHIRFLPRNFGEYDFGNTGAKE